MGILKLLEDIEIAEAKPVRFMAICESKVLITPHVSGVTDVIVLTLSVCVCVSGFTQATLYTTTTIYGVLVHQEGAICTTKAQYALWCTRETMFFEKFRGP